MYELHNLRSPDLETFLNGLADTTTVISVTKSGAFFEIIIKK